MSDTSDAPAVEEREDPWERMKRKYWGRDWDLDRMVGVESDDDGAE